MYLLIDLCLKIANSNRKQGQENHKTFHSWLRPPLNGSSSFENSKASLFTCSSAGIANILFSISCTKTSRKMIILRRQLGVSQLLSPLLIQWLTVVTSAVAVALPVTFFQKSAWKEGTAIRKTARGSASAVCKPESAEWDVLTFQKRTIWSCDKQPGAENLPSIPILQRSYNNARQNEPRLNSNSRQLAQTQTETVRPP